MYFKIINYEVVMNIQGDFKKLKEEFFLDMLQELKEAIKLLEININWNTEYSQKYSTKIYTVIVKDLEQDRSIILQEVEKKNHKDGPFGHILDLLAELMLELESTSCHDPKYYETNGLPKIKHLDLWL